VKQVKDFFGNNVTCVTCVTVTMLQILDNKKRMGSRKTGRLTLYSRQVCLLALL